MIKGRSVLVLSAVGMAAVVLCLGMTPLSAQEAASDPMVAAPRPRSVLKSAEAPVAEEKEKSVEKKIEGVVTGTSPQGVAVEYAVDEKEGGREIWLNYAQGVRFSGVEKLSDIQEGDTVAVVYDEAGSKRRTVKEIALIRKKPADPVEAMEPSVEDEEE